MMRRYFTAVPGLLVLLLAGTSLAQSTAHQASFVDPFDLGTGAGPSAMGATIAAPGDIWSLTNNPAGLADVKALQVGFSHLRWTFDQSASYVGAAFGNGAGVGASYVDHGTIYEADPNGLTGNQLRSDDVGLIGGWGFRLPIAPDVALGVSAQAVQRNIVGFRSTWEAANAGVQWNAMPGVLTLGAELDNVGSAVRYRSGTDDEPQPTSVGGGVSLRIPPGLVPQSSIVLGADVRKTRFQDVYVRAGGEIWFANTIAARAAYLGGEDEGKFTLGTGIHYGTFNLDYSFRDMNDLGTTHRISVSMGLGSLAQ